MPITYTPIRYPGGKSKIYPLVKSIIDANNLQCCTYCEAFAGGSGLSMKLLLKNDVSKVVINDLDRAVYCMWDEIVNDSESLCEFIESVPLTPSEWKKHRKTYQSQGGIDDSTLGKAAFYLNRTNISGILGGGLIGGVNQNGPYKMDARFNRANLVEKVRRIAARSDDITVLNKDAVDFIDGELPKIDYAFAYFDPPYVEKGPELYRNSFDENDHRFLAKKILGLECGWMVTYDNDPLIDDVYSGYIRGDMSIRYSAYSASFGIEKLILRPGLSLGSYELSA